MEIIDLIKSKPYQYYTEENNEILNEETENVRHLSFSILDPDKLVKVNDLKEITNPIFFVRDNIPTSDGLLSNEIFGITKDDRANIFAYIDLHEWFINPLCYKVWCRMDKSIKNIVHGLKNYKITSSGYLEEDENGSTGIEFLRKNIDKIKIRPTESNKRDINIDFIQKNKNVMFMRKQIVIPAYYRDVNTEGKYVGVGDINKLYASLLIAVRGLKETQDYGLSISHINRGRIQEIILEIYNWLTDEPNLAKKHGIVRRANLSKTADYATRLVLSAPELKAESVEDIEVDMEHSAIPLASICANFFPYMIFHIRRFFENEFNSEENIAVYDEKTKTVKRVQVQDPQIQFSDERIKKEIERFMFGYSNRFIPISLKDTNNKEIIMYFKGYKVKKEDIPKLDDPGNLPIVERPLTWCDVIYMAAIEATKDKMVLLTRYPIDCYLNQFPSKVIVSSTKETEPMIVNKTLYKSYPKIREEDIGSNTSNLFIDTVNISNLLLEAIGGDYDGDQVTVKGVYSIEANAELEKHIKSKANYIMLGGQNVRNSSKEAIQALYNLTKVLPGTKLSKVAF